MFYFDKRSLYVFLILMVVLNAGRFLNPEYLLIKILTIPGVLLAITLHEFAHGYAAVKLGDETPKNQGRLSLNPLAHMDPIGTVMLLFAGFGWGKPVQVNTRNFKRTISMDKAEAIVSIAGPLMNLLLATVFMFIYGLLYKFCPGMNRVLIGKFINSIIEYTVYINIGLGVFNLIPLPPLDGSKVLKMFLPYNMKNWLEARENIFYIVFVALWIFGVLGVIISPAINIIADLLEGLVGLVLGL